VFDPTDLERTKPSPVSKRDEIRQRIAPFVRRTPLIQLDIDTPQPVYLKLENLQPTGSFKVRGSANVILQADHAALGAGIVTPSAGNMALAVAWHANRIGVPCTVLVPDHAPAAKLDGVLRYGARVVRRPFEQWWDIVTSHHASEHPGLFVHPFEDTQVMEGNGSIASEILEDLPDVGTVIVPFGGGGLSCGIAQTLRAEGSSALVYAAEVETSAALARALTEGKSSPIEYKPSFVDGIGSKFVLDSMFELASALLAGSIVSTLAEVSDAIRVTAGRQKIVIEGAAAAAVAPVLRNNDLDGPIVCVVSGGNINLDVLAGIIHAGDRDPTDSGSA
jgi:threonine dehydratase